MINPWEEIKQPAKDVSARRVDHKHPLDLFWAKNHLGKYLLIYEFVSDDTNIKLPKLSGIEIYFIKANQGFSKNRIENHLPRYISNLAIHFC